MEVSFENDSPMVTSTIVVLTSALGATILFVFLLFGWNKKPSSVKTSEDSSSDFKKENKKPQKPRQKLQKKPSTSFNHAHLHTTLKGHSGVVMDLDVSVNGKYLVSCSDDQTTRVWSIKEFGSGNKSILVNVEYDHANQVRFSPDSRAFLVGLHRGNTIRVFRLDKKEDGVTPTFSPIENDFPKSSKADLLSIGVAMHAYGGSFVMTAYKDTSIIIRDLKGEVLHSINTNQGNNMCALVSPCGRFVASSGWSPDVKVWAVIFDKTGGFVGVNRAFELKGHTSSVWSFDFNNDSTRMITISKDGQWRLYDTSVEYEKEQDPYLIKSGSLDVGSFSVKNHPALIALSPDGNVAAVACSTSVVSFSTVSGVKELETEDVHTQAITAIKFDIAGRYIITSGDRQIRVFYNVLGYKETIRDLETKLKKQNVSSATYARFHKQIDDAKKALTEIENRKTKHK